MGSTGLSQVLRQTLNKPFQTAFNPAETYFFNTARFTIFHQSFASNFGRLANTS